MTALPICSMHATGARGVGEWVTARSMPIYQLDNRKLPPKLNGRTALSQAVMRVRRLLTGYGRYGNAGWCVANATGLVGWAVATNLYPVGGGRDLYCLCCAQDDRKLIAYSSVTHMGIIKIGIFTFDVQGVHGASCNPIAAPMICKAVLEATLCLDRFVVARHRFSP